MLLKSGKHAGKSTELLLLKWPDWAYWMMEHHPKSIVSKDFFALVYIFDSKPIVKRCARCACRATRASAVYNSSRGLMFWCDTCDPSSTGASGVGILHSFMDAIFHVSPGVGPGTRQSKRWIIRGLSSAMRN